MAPGYRNSTRRHNRSGLVDHDVFEGLPVRQWRRDLVTVDPTAASENNTQQNNIWAVELPYGMPKDSHLLPKHSQDLLRAARSGRIYRCSVPIEEEEADTEINTSEKPEKKDEAPQNHGFLAKAWKQVPRHLEGADVDYLAKKRKGLKKAPERLTRSLEPTLAKTTVKKVDTPRIEYVPDMLVPQGQQASENLNSMESYPLSTPEDLEAQALLKKKGPVRKTLKPVSRGKKKKIIPPTSTPNDSLTEHSINNQANDGITSESDARSMPANNDDIEMGEESVGNSDEGEENEQDDELNDLSTSVSNITPTEITGSSTTNNAAQVSLPAQPEQATTSDSSTKDDSNIFKHNSLEPPTVNSMPLVNNAMTEDILTSAPVNTRKFVIPKHVEVESKVEIRSEGKISDVEKKDHALDLDSGGWENNDFKDQVMEKFFEPVSNPTVEILPHTAFEQHKSLPSEQYFKDEFFKDICEEVKHNDALQPQTQKFTDKDSSDAIDITLQTHQPSLEQNSDLAPII
ncbi:putative lyr family protein [Golovinomyces cichoracearum]|uniref:Putative lyr family protein n=1 Tax=Golovinomyces cichoracearum TaxID=62708 RepID=A0A420IY86_9PEZI|nr:putative lyr family protein [Golovinomyces cichoracearum]